MKKYIEKIEKLRAELKRTKCNLEKKMDKIEQTLGLESEDFKKIEFKWACLKSANACLSQAIYFLKEEE